MSRRLVGTVIVAGLIATSASAATFVRAKGSFSTFLFELKYDPTRPCSKPYRPYRMDKWEREQYIREGQAYLACMQETADADVEYAQQIIREGYEKAADDFLEEVRRGY